MKLPLNHGKVERISRDREFWNLVPSLRDGRVGVDSARKSLPVNTSFLSPEDRAPEESLSVEMVWKSRKGSGDPTSSDAKMPGRGV